MPCTDLPSQPLGACGARSGVPAGHCHDREPVAPFRLAGLRPPGLVLAAATITAGQAPVHPTSVVIS